MRTTVRIDDDLLQDLKEQAHQDGVYLAVLVNRALRRGMESLRQAGKSERLYREKTFSMGEPKVDLRLSVFPDDSQHE